MHPLPDLPEGVGHGHADLVKGDIRRARRCRVRGLDRLRLHALTARDQDRRISPLTQSCQLHPKLSGTSRRTSVRQPVVK